MRRKISPSKHLWFVQSTHCCLRYLRLFGFFFFIWNSYLYRVILSLAG